MVIVVLHEIFFFIVMAAVGSVIEYGISFSSYQICCKEG